MYFYMILAMISFESFVMEPEPDFLSTFPDPAGIRSDQVHTSLLYQEELLLHPDYF